MLVFHETLLVPVLMYGNETMLWKERSRIRIIQIDDLRCLFRRRDKVPHARIRELCGVTKGLNESNDEGVLWWFGLVERMIKFPRVCAGSRSVGRARKR